MKTKISVTLDDPVLEQVKQLAEAEDRSLSSYINLVLKAHLEQREKRGGSRGNFLDSPKNLY